MKIHFNTRLVEGVPSSKHKLYNTWYLMKTRCDNPKCKYYDRYGGRGISICKEWYSFDQFVADMGDRPEGLTLDRIDNDSGYSKSNCRWATAKEQNNNKRPSRPSKIYKTNKSGIRGVSWHKDCGKWQVQGYRSGQTFGLGLFKNLKDAEDASNKFYSKPSKVSAFHEKLVDGEI